MCGIFAMLLSAESGSMLVPGRLVPSIGAWLRVGSREITPARKRATAAAKEEGALAPINCLLSDFYVTGGEAETSVHGGILNSSSRLPIESLSRCPSIFDLCAKWAGTTRDSLQ